MDDFGFGFDFEKTVFLTVKDDGVFDGIVVTKQTGMRLSQVGINNSGVVAVDNGACLVKAVVLKKGIEEIGMIDNGTGGGVVGEGEQSEVLQLGNGDEVIMVGRPAGMGIDHNIQNVFIKCVNKIFIFIFFKEGEITEKDAGEIYIGVELADGLIKVMGFQGHHVEQAGILKVLQKIFHDKGQQEGIAFGKGNERCLAGRLFLDGKIFELVYCV